jgi:hypothetical protein
LGSFPLGSHCDLAVPQENLLSSVNALKRVTYSQSKCDRVLPDVIRLWFVESVRDITETNVDSLDICTKISSIRFNVIYLFIINCTIVMRFEIANNIIQ